MNGFFDLGDELRGKAVFVIPPLCSQKHTHMGKQAA